MKKYAQILFLVCFISIFNVKAVKAADTVPRRLNYQGRLMDTSDNLLTGTYYLCFSIWDNPTVGMGSQQWPSGTPTPTQITSSNGVFSAEIGSADTLDLDFDTYDYYLQIYVNDSSSCTSGGETLSPRQHLTSAAYSINADMLDGLDAATSGANTHIVATDSSGNLISSAQVQVGSFASAPTALGVGALYYNSTDGNIYVWDGIGSAWVDLTAVGGGGYWQLSANVVNPTVSTYDVAVGGTTLAASIFGIDEDAGNFYFGYDNSANPTLLFEATDDDAGTFGFNTNDAFYFSDANVGIGINNPGSLLQVSGGDVVIDRSTATTGITRNLTIGGVRVSSGNDYARLNFQNYDDAADYTGARISSENDGSASDGDLRFYTANAGTLSSSPHLLIDSVGNIGVGTTPGYLFDVAETSAETAAISRPTIRNTLTIAPTSASSTIFRGMWNRIIVPDTTSVNLATITGGYTEVSYDGTGSLGTIKGIDVLANVLSGSGSIIEISGVTSNPATQATTNVTSAYSFFTDPTYSGSVSAHYSYYSDSSAATNDWGIYTLNAKNYFAGDLMVAGTTLTGGMFALDESAGNFYFGYDNSANPTLLFEATDNDAGTFGFNTNDAFYFTNASVGVGTTSPASGYSLDIDGEVQMSTNSDIYTSVASDILGGGASSGRLNVDSLHTNGIGYGQIYIEGSRIDGNQGIFIGSGAAGGQSTQDVTLGNNDELFVDTSTNRVGIGLNNPAEVLDVYGDIKVAGDTHITFPFLIQTEQVSDAYGHSDIVLKPSGASASYPGSKLVIDSGDNTQANRTSSVLLRLGGTEKAQISVQLTDNRFNIDNIAAPATSSGHSYMRFSSSYTDKFHFRGDGNAYATGWISPYQDLAEYYPVEDETIVKANIVAVSPSGKLTKGQVSEENKLLGVISTNPGFVAGVENIEGDTEGLPVALAGKVPVIMTDLNGALNVGDNVAISPIPGIGMKTKKPGKVVGQLLESSSDWNNIRCPTASSLDNIPWPHDDGDNSSKPCFKVQISSLKPSEREYLKNNYGLTSQDYLKVGKLMMFVNLSWYEPESYLAKINKLISAYDSGLLNGGNNSVPSNLVLNSIQAGSGTFRQLSANTLEAGNGRFKVDALGNVANIGNLTTKKLIADTIQANELAAKNSNISIKLADGKGFSLKNSQGEEVLGISEQGKLRFSQNTNSSTGTGKIPVGNTTVFIPNTLVNGTSKIFISIQTPIGQTIAITEKREGAGFTAALKRPEAIEIIFDYWIID